MNGTAYTVLVVEDDPDMRLGLRDNLELEGYHVLTAESVREGLNAGTSRNADLIVLDLMLPDGDGTILCRQLRLQGFRKPIIMLTARGEEMDKVLGLEVGSDDYVVKPFSLRELLARIRAHLRRSVSQSEASPVPVGLVLADFERHLLTRAGQLLEVSAKEIELLRYFVAHRGETLTRDRLLAEVWGRSWAITTRTVDNFVVRLRKHIELEPAQPRYLITVHGRGYKLLRQ
nr:response regulator transcription factor [Gammaproteobacteria bacterium]